MKRRTIIIKWEMNRGGAFSDYDWSGIFEDTREIFDYHTKEHIKKDCIKLGYNYKVIRTHRDNTETIVEEYNHDK